jgi:hypothetical protein
MPPSAPANIHRFPEWGLLDFENLLALVFESKGPCNLAQMALSAPVDNHFCPERGLSKSLTLARGERLKALLTDPLLSSAPADDHRCPERGLRLLRRCDVRFRAGGRRF